MKATGADPEEGVASLSLTKLLAAKVSTTRMNDSGFRINQQGIF